MTCPDFSGRDLHTLEKNIHSHLLGLVIKFAFKNELKQVSTPAHAGHTQRIYCIWADDAFGILKAF
jgi:hypothetical protein